MEEVIPYYTFVKESAAGQLTLTAVRELLGTSYKKLQRLENSSRFEEDSPTYENACLEIGASLYSPLIDMLSADRIYTLMLPELLPDSKLVLGLPTLSQEDSVDLVSHQKALELIMEKAVSVCLSEDPRFFSHYASDWGIVFKGREESIFFASPRGPRSYPNEPGDFWI